MLTLDKLSDEELRRTVRHLVVRDRMQILELTDHLGEVEARQLHLQWGFGSMWDFAHRELGLSDGVAHLRITISRLVRKRPEVREMLSDGRLGLCVACDLLPLVGATDFQELLAAAMKMSKRAFKDFLVQRNPTGAGPQ